MKASVAAMLVFSIFPAIAADKLMIASFEIGIDVRCPEGAVSCAVFESGELVVTQGDKLLFRESGTWQ